MGAGAISCDRTGGQAAAPAGADSPGAAAGRGRPAACGRDSGDLGVADAAGHGFELDCYWPEFRFAVELDVFETHGTRAAFERDRKRQEDLLLHGIAMTRVTGPRLEREPEEVMRRVGRLLAQRRGVDAGVLTSGVAR